ncbi:MAG: helix-turn-helix transcriptional regulator [Chloroflexaceae bacterium]|nr:helix-turn-helix transcriptional regulator [Chloroflexaceae bacterium]
MIQLRLRIGEILRERGISTRDLADRASIAVATARALALGENERVDMPVIERVAAALNVRPLELFKEIEDGDVTVNNRPLIMLAA